MHAKNRSLFILTAVLALALANISPAQADEEPPADKADIVTLQRVLDLNLGSASSISGDLEVYGTALFFSANANNGIGNELWIYDPAQPVGPSNPIAYDVQIGAGSSAPEYLVVYDGALYFRADGGDGAGFELWKFTWANGAQRVMDLNPGSGHSSSTSMTVYDGALFFAADANNGIGKELWIYDSAQPVGPSNPVAYDVCLGAGSSKPADLAVYNGELYFRADGCDGAGSELWKFTWANGAQRVIDLNPGSGDSFSSSMTVYDGALYFHADGNDGIGQELWMYDPIDGVQFVADIHAGSGSSFPYDLVVYNGALYFRAEGNDGAGHELWKYDPVNGADRVADIWNGSESSYPLSLTVYNGALYFGANGNDGAGIELWKYDNTTTARYRPSRAYDGWILESGENTNAGGTLNAAQTTFTLGDDAQNKQYRSILSFNTSTLPDNAVVISTTLRIRQQGVTGTNPFTTHGNILIDIIKGAFGGNNALQAGDFQAAPGKASVGVIKNLPDVNMWYTTALKTIAYPFINKAGVTQLRLRFTKDDNNDNGADFLRFFSADSAIISDFPVLEVKYYIP